MHREESDQLTPCSDCGTATLAGEERGFSGGPGLVLCAACASRRGGTWDEAQDRWTTEPDLTGLEPETP